MSTQCNSGDHKLDAAVTRWFQYDKNPKTINEVKEDIKSSSWDKLKKSMLGRQKFGTAGIRAKMAAGFNCINDVVVLQTAQGICSYIKKVCHKQQLQTGIVLGYDGRYNSKRFAELSAKVFVSNDVPVRLFSNVCPTPYISFATRHYSCAVGIMVTASHNPKEDNGYKVYWGNGSQIIGPHDDNILEEVEQNLSIKDEHWDITDINSHPLVTDCLEEVTKEYQNYIRQSLTEQILSDNKKAGINAVYSAMHGVGNDFIMKAFEVANLKPPTSVPEQKLPDPEFSTVKFPNPEEPQCLKLSQELAEKKGFSLVLVNDPDADRLAVAEYDVRTKTWKVFNGNEMGALLGWWLFEQYKAKPEVSPHDVYLISSIVSSKMLKTIAHSEGCHFVETLTGFKWMGNTTLVLKNEGKLPLFAFEEAIGYMCSHKVPDKDGVSAAVQVASLASYLHIKKSSLNDQLQSLYKQYGYHVSHNSYYVCHEPAILHKIFRRIRNYGAPGEYPKQIGSCEIVSIEDFAAGVRIPEKPANGGKHLNLSLSVIGTGLDSEYTSGEMVMFQCGNGLSVIIRTSGTEPKVKYYTEMVAKAESLSEQEQIRKDLVSMAQMFVKELLQPEENGLLE